MAANDSRYAVRSYTETAFQAVVDAIIPHAHWSLGAIPAKLHLYVIGQIDQSQFVPAGMDEEAPAEPLSLSTAKLLDIGAAELISKGLAMLPLNPMTVPDAGIFARMSRIDRLRTIALLNQTLVPLSALPPPYHNNPGLVQTMMDSLHQLTMFGWDSEWTGYGTTRLLPPNSRHIEFFPPVWCQIGYPGPALGYRALRGFGTRPAWQKGDNHG